MPTYLCAQLDSAGVCTAWVEYAPQYILPPLSLDEACFLGLSFWTMLIVAWGITSLRLAFTTEK